VVTAKKSYPRYADVSIYEIMERCSLNEQTIGIENTDVRDDFISTPFPEPPMND
jgi:hypothetical protein